MAEGPVAALPSTQLPAMASGMSNSLSDEEKNKIAECERILRFRDQVLSGSHPRIKAPSHLFAPKQSNESRGLAAPVSATVSSGQLLGKPPPKGPKLSSANATMPTNGSGSQVAANFRSFAANAQHAASANRPSVIQPPGLDSSSASTTMTGIPTGPKADAGKRHVESPANAQFDPVLLTKSEDLIKAELQLQRQRLERALADQLQQQRAATKAANAVEAPVEFDLAAVLMKALQLAQSSAPPQTDANIAANRSGPDSDSDDTFYSSKHDTPESHLEQRIPSPAKAEIAQEREDSPYEPPMVMDASPVPGQVPVVAIPPSVTNSFAVTHATTTQQEPFNPFSQSVHPVAQPSTSSASAPAYNDHRHGASSGAHSTFVRNNTAQEATGVPMEIISSQESGEGSSSRDSAVAAGGQSSAQNRLQPFSRQMIEQAFGRRQSPILRAHNLSPIAPQPAHVSPLATSRQPPVPQQDALPAQATSAQVAALRADHSNGSSPDSSPQGKANRKGKRNKKRKADRIAANNAPVPYIKPEPRSQSPVTAPQYPRQPNKRIRSSQQARREHSTDEPRYEEVVESTHLSSYPPRIHREDRGPIYGSPGEPHIQQPSRPVIVTEASRHERDYHEDLRPVETVRYVRRGSPGAQPYPPAEVRTYRSVSRAAVDRPYPYYNSRDLPRTVVRPVADRDRSRSPVLLEERATGVMAPPQHPSRVVVDEFGREYIEPPSRQEPVIIRRSVAPRPAYGDREDYHDPSRATSRIIRRSVAPSSFYGEPEVVYERGPPPRAASIVPGPSRYDEEVVYRTPASPAGHSSAGYTTTRRVVARSEYPPEYRYYRERDYPSQPPSQALGGYYEVRDPRAPIGGEPHRDYIVRSTTVRPESSVRPEVVRMSSVRPEPIPGEYGAPIRLDAQAMPPPRSYSVRPMAPPPSASHQPQYTQQWPEYEVRSEYEARPAYREQVRGEDDGVTYIDSAPRESYR